MMSDDNGGTPIIRIVFGILLIAGGCFAAVWVLHTVYTMFNTAEEFQFVKRISAIMLKEAKGDALGGAAQTLATVFGYIIAVLLLAISASIAKALLLVGANLLQPDLKALVEKLKEELEKLRS